MKNECQKLCTVVSKNSRTLKNNCIKFKNFCFTYPKAYRISTHFLTSGPWKVHTVHSLGELNFKNHINSVIGFKIILVLSTLILTKHSPICQVVWNLKITNDRLQIIIYGYTVGQIIWLYQNKLRTSDNFVSELLTQHLDDRLTQSHFSCSYSQTMTTKNWYLKGCDHLDF
jgi:hypothetical protein